MGKVVGLFLCAFHINSTFYFSWKRFMEILREAQPQSGRQAASRNLPIGSTLSPASNHVNVAQKCSDSPAEVHRFFSKVYSSIIIYGDWRRNW